MFKDRKEELRRLEEELLLEAQQEEEEALWEEDGQWDDEAQWDEENWEEEPDYSNPYPAGSAYDPYSSGYDPEYEEDPTLEEYWSQVHQARVRGWNRRLLGIILILLAAILGILAYCYLRFQGVIP